MVSRPTLLRHASTGLMVMGLLLLALAGGYFAYVIMAQAQVQQLAASELASPGVASVIPEAQGPGGSPTPPQEGAPPATDPSVAGDGSVALQTSPEQPPLMSGIGQASLLSSEYLSPSDTIRTSIPSIGVESRVVELGVVWEDGQWVWDTPDHAVGHYKSTANPGEAGNVVMSGHISSPLKGEGNVFKNLPKIEVGAAITITTPVAEFVYRVVEKKVVEPTATWVMDPTPYPILTLITCVPDWVYSHRLVVTAVPTERMLQEQPRP